MQRIVYICDECGEEFEATAGLELKAAWEEAKDVGWRCWKDGDEWKHKCEECQG